MADNEGCLWRRVGDVVRHAAPDEIEREMRTQMERAEILGLPITLLDSHMGALFAWPGQSA